MIPDYKLFHGAVIAELVHCLQQPLTVDELLETGRLSSYILDGRIGLQIKHSSNRLRPWQFTFTKGNVAELGALQMTYTKSFVALVCNTDGIVCVTIEELNAMLSFGTSDQGWIKVDRRRGEWYSVWGGSLAEPKKKGEGVGCIVEALCAQAAAS